MKFRSFRQVLFFGESQQNICNQCLVIICHLTDIENKVNIAMAHEQEKESAVDATPDTENGNDARDVTGDTVSTPESDLVSTSDAAHERSVVEVEREWSSESSDDELEEEAWDLSLGALVNSSSVASSLSSLAQQPSSPSPVAVAVASGARTVKPDLLEEANRIEELDLMDYSAVSNPDLPPELNVANIFRDRHYVHHPNQRLNVTLTYVMAFALAAVVGFALGHIIGSYLHHTFNFGSIGVWLRFFFLNRRLI